ncbi:hypothetical protein CP960_01420 [Malaciobacter halophilus]|uniref:DUF3955 domain-containing protein n=1 Tax=Malaciobacter halophilus TaxID=197482 RepID=A0A2N1J601_9BACT|nr:hypothetical protein [Malaciobacter halophilus]AXH09538.1 putative membrane protein [Malaciobacter halophilus]PKI81998.1 hypothetical protein CP960_01420 [Malaciobacter halophilus]
MSREKTTVDISITTARGSFITSCLCIICGFILMFVGSDNGLTELTVKTKDVTINFYSFVPGVVFTLFGAILAAWTVHRLIKK